MTRKTKNKKETHLLFIDGIALGNPGPSAWAAIRVLGAGDVIEIGGAERESTRTRIELIGLIEGLRGLPAGDLTIFTDSTYLYEGATEHSRLWIKRGWKTRTGNVANRELWEQALTLLEGRAKFGATSWRRIPGRGSMRGNARADEIATGFAEYARPGKSKSEKQKPALFKGKLSDYPIDILNMRFNAALAEKRRRARHRDRAKAYSYLSILDGRAERHLTWEECRNRVSGKPNAKALKTLTRRDERQILKRWRATLS